jgi:hypothetical protein
LSLPSLGARQRLRQRRGFLSLGNEYLKQMRFEREQLIGDPFDLGRVVFVLKQ